MKASSSLVVAVGLSFSLLVWPVSPVEGKVKPKNLAAVGGGCSVAVDPAGYPHVVYQSTDYHLYHARFDGKAWQHELVDGTSDCGWGNSIAIDAQGRIHISYHAERMNPYRQPLVYAYFDGTLWHVAELEVYGWQTCLKLDAAGHPHILFSGNYGTLGYARFDGNAWHIEDTGLQSSPYTASLALDAEGHAHVAYSVNYSGYFYATNESGTWQSTILGYDGQPAAIDLDHEGNPHVALAVPGTIRIHSYDGMNWMSEDVIDPSVTSGFYFDGVALKMDNNDREHLLISATITMGARSAAVSIYAFNDGMGWNGMLVDPKNAGYDPSLVLTDAGIAYGTYCAAGKKDTATAKWVRLALPDLAGIWSNVSLTEAGGISTVTATVTVHNNGVEKSVPSHLLVVISSDSTVDMNDEMWSVMPKVKGLKPGGMLEMTVAFRYPGSLTGKYLIGVIDPELLTCDRNMLDNLVPVLLGP